MKQKIQKSLGILSISVLMLNGIAYFDIPTHFLSGTLFVAEALIDEEVVSEPVVSEKVFIPATPRKLVKQAKTYTNRNGYEVFHGYEASKLSIEEQLTFANSIRRERNQKKHTGGSSNFRTVNYRKENYASSMKASAGKESKLLGVQITKEEKNKIGYAPKVKARPDRVRRYSLRYSLRNESAATTFKNARDQKNERNAIHSAAWEQNRTPWENPNEVKTRPSIQIKRSDSRRELIEYFEKKRQEEEEFQKQLEKELREEFGGETEDPLEELE